MDDKRPTSSRQVPLAILDEAPVPLLILGPDGKVRHASAYLLHLAGLSSSQLLGRRWEELLVPERARERLRGWFGCMIDGHGSSPVLAPLLSTGGEELQLQWSPMLVNGPDGDREVLLVGSDLTCRLRAEELLRDERRQHTELLQRMQFGIVIHGPDTRILFSNREASRILGLTVEQLQGKAAIDPAWTFLREDGSPMPHEEFPVNRVARTLRPLPDLVVGVQRRPGDLAWGLVRAFPELDDQGQLVQIVVTFDDLTERKQMEEALVVADKRKSEFLAVLSHELRNPMAAIRNSLYVMDRASPGDERSRRARAIVARQMTHLARLVDDLLDVTRIARGKIQLQRERLDLRDLLLRTVDDHRAEFEANNIRLETRLTPTAPWIRGDATRIAQIIGNLLGNAVKFTPPGASVEVQLQQENGEAILRVIDTGIGMTPEVIARMFEPFTQDPQSLARTRGGLGLGLALVKGLVELHGGTVSASSRGPGAGSEFAIRFPLSDEGQPRADGTAGPERSSRPRRILVIEDNADSAESLVSLLRLRGHQVFHSLDGPRGIAMAQEHRPEIVLCDVGLPGMSGYEVAQALRADERLRQTVLVALTGYALTEDKRQAMQAGFDHHLSKPLELSALEKVLESLEVAGAA